jgi:RNA polymerase-associated protein LEO1
MSIKLRVENTVRWRWKIDDNGHDVRRNVIYSGLQGSDIFDVWQRRQSNSRIIRWSDGTLSLKLGKELFDITQTIDTSGAVPRQAIGGGTQTAQQATQRAAVDSQTAVKAQGLTYLVAQHKRAEILQCEAMITGTMSLRPTGMQSETHRMLVRAVGQKHTKVARLRMAPDPTMDPEREMKELLKQASKKTRKPRGDDDALGGVRRRRGSYARKRSGDDMWSDDDDDDDVSGGGGASEDDYGQAGPSARKAKRRKSGEEETSKRGPGEYQNDDFLVADSEEDADFAESDEGESRRQKKRKSRRGEAEEQDDLDKLDAKIEAEERRRRQQEKTPGSTAVEATENTEEAMDVESEEDEEEWGAKRAGTGSRRKRAIDFDDEEDE